MGAGLYGKRLNAYVRKLVRRQDRIELKIVSYAIPVGGIVLVCK